MATHKKKAKELNATLVFADESGVMMSPLVRRGWAPVGQTPTVVQTTRSHRKVSAIAGLTLSPKHRRARLLFRMYAERNITAALCVEFLRGLLRQQAGHIILVWDRLVAHKSKLVNQWAAKHPRLHLEYFPPYAPDLNPTEYVWGNLKYHRMANYAAPNVTELARTARRHCRQLQKTPHLLFACLRHSGLFFDL